jgi:deoxyribodipyrimidine photolyase-related protein
MTQHSHLILVLADQLSWHNPALADADPNRDQLLLAEVVQETTYVKHNKHKIAFLLAAMRHFRVEAEQKGFTVHYTTIDEGVVSLLAAVQMVLARTQVNQVILCEPGEWRLRCEFESWPDQLGIACEMREDSRFLASHAVFDEWADGQKSLRMEYFYRLMRKRYQLLLDASGGPEGGQWNYDADNRSGWRNKDLVPARRQPAVSPITRQVIIEVDALFADHPGDLKHFCAAVTRAEAEQQLDDFLTHFLPLFGQYQDALAEESPTLFHGLIGLYLNAGLLEPLEVCRQVERRYQLGEVSLAATEGFIRQILGWREYVRGIYWRFMPHYAEHNTWQAVRPLPAWFWTAETPMRCLSKAIGQSLDLGYAHHIQRLMVIGNFALIAGLSVKQVCEWYLAVYVDAYEWVELPNTLGMALNADGGIMASKPYAASGNYIAKQGNHCAQCQFDPKQTTGPKACPYNSLYWHFIDQNLASLSTNPRMSLITSQWKKRDPEQKQSITGWAEHVLDQYL